MTAVEIYEIDLLQESIVLLNIALIHLWKVFQVHGSLL